MRPTEKLYYTHPNRLTAETSWQVGTEVSKIIIMSSPAFPEGGGQTGDSGVIEQGGIVVPFVDTQKCGVGRPIVRQDFPIITVEHQVEISLGETIPVEFDPMKPIVVRVNGVRRYQLSRSHSAAHLVWLALTERFGNLYPVVRGCHIVENQGRFDLLLTEKPSEQDLRDAEGFIAKWVAADHEIVINTLLDEPECRVWRAADKDIPCGGTHLLSTKGVGTVRLRVKSKGKSGFRVSYELNSEEATIK